MDKVRFPSSIKKNSKPKPKNKKKKKRKKPKPFDVFAHVNRNDISDIFKDEACRGAKTLKSGHYTKIIV